MATQMLSMMPFGIIGGIVEWLYLHRRRARRSKATKVTPLEKQGDERDDK